jgi:hypothetical protein
MQRESTMIKQSPRQKSSCSSIHINPNPFRFRPTQVEIVILPTGRTILWKFKDQDSFPGLEESICRVMEATKIAESVINEIKISGAVGLAGLADLSKGQTTLQQALSQISQGVDQVTDKNLRQLLLTLQKLMGGLVQITVGQKKLLGTLLFQSSTRRKR